MEKIREVHVAMLWREVDRILEPVAEYTPEVVYLLEHERDDVTHPDYHADVRETLETTVPTLRTCPVDLFDMYDVMGAVTTIADRHARDEVRVNVTSGTKRSAVGATMACMDEGTDATSYVVDPEERSVGAEQPLTAGYDGAAQLTTYQIDSPTPDQVASLAIIEAHETDAKSAKKRTLLEEGMRYGFEFLEGTESPSKGDYNVLKARITEPLRDRSYIQIEERGTRHYLTLTDAGRQTLRAFRHRAEDVIQDLEERHVASDGDSLVEFELDNPVGPLFEDSA
ncbi:hypothetical protein SAMN05216559_1776 [Halomicrobium zhouii]|uniref:Uncharacterized protein n=1 Tax=Halomicrobium zhouii TaxID=767519 RepID=A0A1I6L0T3_9EURY|nr:DUF6293 family protein [Halomicrobium zhouii]SFR97093.1 hypothetical protein SAMN05216559_1776 [Halomicrobium zhouii]